MIYYFSGTGNTKFIGDYLADHLNDEQVSMSDYTRTGKALSKTSDKPHIFLVPIYAWRYPRPVEELIRQAELKGSHEVYCITTRESQSGNAGADVRRSKCSSEPFSNDEQKFYSLGCLHWVRCLRETVSDGEYNDERRQANLRQEMYLVFLLHSVLPQGHD